MTHTSSCQYVASTYSVEGTLVIFDCPSWKGFLSYITEIPILFITLFFICFILLIAAPLSFIICSDIHALSRPFHNPL